MEKGQINRSRRAIQKGKVLSVGFLKLNFDAVFNYERGIVGLGIVVCDDQGKVLFVKTISVVRRWSVERGKLKLLWKLLIW